MDRCGVAVWRATGLINAGAATQSDSDVGSSPLSINLDIDAGGIAVACIGEPGGGGTTTCTWGGLTLGGTTDREGDRMISAAQAEFAAAQTALAITATVSGMTAAAMAGASFR
jgi:hypothetical protein